MDVFSADWLGICRRATARHKQLFETAPSSAERTVYEGIGEGGDRTLVIDRQCEDVVFEELERLASAGASFVAISEERGEVTFGDGGAARVVIDPIDGSLNARRTIPSHSLSIALASGPTMADVEFGFVHDFGAGEEFTARRGEGARLNGAPVAVAEAAERLEVLGVESAEPSLALPVLGRLAGGVYRLRIIGSLAITVAYVGAGRFDGAISLRPCRSVDIAAAQLIAREAGAEVAFGELGLGGASLDLDARYPIAAACCGESLAALLDAQHA